MKLKKKKKKTFFFLIFFFLKKKSPESATKFSGRSGNRKHSYFFFWPYVFSSDLSVVFQDTCKLSHMNLHLYFGGGARA